MTARTERVVRAVPGATLDRRDGEGNPTETLSFARMSLRRIPEWRFSDQEREVAEQEVCPTRREGSTLDVAEPTVRTTPTSAPLVERTAISSRDRADWTDDRLARIIYQFERYRGALEIMVFLYRIGSASKARLRAHLVPGQEALDAALMLLVRNGIVERNPDENRNRKFPFSIDYRLTERGRTLVETPILNWSLENQY